MSSHELSEWMAFSSLEAKEQQIAKDTDAETAWRMVWDSDGADLGDE
jgi:hypothetical protein